MVWSVGMSRMKAFARLLEAGSFTKIVPPDNVRKQKMTAADILGELRDANELNLLDEKDMHVFGLKPMDDPLYLVSCNFCNKTINASQYFSHADLCKYLGFQNASVEVADVDGSSEHKKTTRKRRNKVSKYSRGKQIQLERDKTDDSVGSRTFQDDHMGTVSSLSTLTDDSLDGMRKLDVSSFNCVTEDLSTSSVGRLKRCKLMDARTVVKIDERESMDAKCSRCQDVQTCRENSKAETTGYGKPIKKLLDHQIADVPAPIATKMYYSLQSNHLRSALSLMFHKAYEVRSSSDVVSSESIEGKLASTDTCAVLDESGNEFCEPKEHDHQTAVRGPVTGFRTIADFRASKSASGLTTNILSRPRTAGSLDMLNR